MMKSNQLVNEIAHLQGVVIPDLESSLTHALKHLKEMTYMACSGEITVASSERIDAALAFLKLYEPMLKEESKQPDTLTDDLPF
jgi:hypothetical protein